MANSKRSTSIKAALAQASQENKTNYSVPKAPSLPDGELDSSVNAGIQARLVFTQLREHLSVAGTSLEDFLENEFDGLRIMKSQRIIKTPSGNEYSAVFTHLTYEELKDNCVIDDDNIRDQSERTKEALTDLIDEIGNGFQLQAAIAYINEEGKISLVDGSRRFAAALFSKNGLDVEIFDIKPESADVLWMVEASDRRKEFSYFDRGRLYSKLLTTYKCTQAALCRLKGYKTTDVNRSIQFFKYVTADLQNYLSVKDCSAREVDKVNNLLKQVHEKSALDELIETLNIEKISTNKDFIDLLSKFVDKLNARRVKTKPLPIVLYEREQAKVEFIKPTASKFVIEFKKISKEDEEIVSNMIKKYFQSK